MQHLAMTSFPLAIIAIESRVRGKERTYCKIVLTQDPTGNAGLGGHFSTFFLCLINEAYVYDAFTL